MSSVNAVSDVKDSTLGPVSAQPSILAQTQIKTQKEMALWPQSMSSYARPDIRRSLWQLVNTLIPFFAFWYVSYRCLEISYGYTLFFSLITALFGVRIFALFHDCGHASFFTSMKANDIVGSILGIICLTPYFAWRHEHAMHHATSGDLDRRGFGDVWTLTYEEYLALPPFKRRLYRLYRNPFVIFVLAPTFAFVVLQRGIDYMNSAMGPREKNSITFNNLALLAVITTISLLIGFQQFLLVQLPVVFIGSSIGVWLFYVQHQYPNTYWERHNTWDYFEAALYGSSFYKLPKVLQWFTANIGFHHIHHLNPRIPNYRLEACHRENPIFAEIPPMTLRTSLRSFFVRVWDEDRHRMIGYRREFSSNKPLS